MDNSFMVLNKVSNVQKKADVIVSFNFENQEYLVYAIDESDETKQVFVSKVMEDSNGKYFIGSISSEEKEKLSKIIYNIVIAVPNNNSGEEVSKLINDLTNDFAITLKRKNYILDIQEYLNSCSIAITNTDVVETAVIFYSNNIKNEQNIDKPLSWEAITKSPKEDEKEVVIGIDNTIPEIEPKKTNSSQSVETTEDTSMSIEDGPVIPDIPPKNIEIKNDFENSVSEVANSDISVNSNNINTDTKDDTLMPNPQADKLAIVSDPSLTNALPEQPNAVRSKNKVNKYIIIGTVCLILSVIVVLTAVILIKNK